MKFVQKNSEIYPKDKSESPKNRPDLTFMSSMASALCHTADRSGGTGASVDVVDGGGSHTTTVEQVPVRKFR